MRIVFTLSVMVFVHSVWASEREDWLNSEIMKTGELSVTKRAERMVQLSQSKDSESRMLAASIIGYYPMRPTCDVSVELLKKLLEDRSVEVRTEAVCASSYYGVRAKPLLPLISKLRKSKDSELREISVSVYYQIKSSLEKQEELERAPK